MIFAVADKHRPAMHEHPVGPRELAREGIAIGTVATPSRSHHRGDRTHPQVDASDGVILSVSDIDAAISGIRNALGTPERSRHGRSAVSGEPGFACTSDSLQAAHSGLNQKNGVALA